MSDLAVLKLWAKSLPETVRRPPADDVEKLSFSVPYPSGDPGAEKAARKLASAYMKSALADFVSVSNAKLYWFSPIDEQTSKVERQYDHHFWRRVVREGWCFYTVRCCVGVVIEKTEATA